MTSVSSDNGGENKNTPDTVTHDFYIVSLINTQCIWFVHYNYYLLYTTRFQYQVAKAGVIYRLHNNYKGNRSTLILFHCSFPFFIHFFPFFKLKHASPDIFL